MVTSHWFLFALGFEAVATTIAPLGSKTSFLLDFNGH